MLPAITAFMTMWVVQAAVFWRGTEAIRRVVDVCGPASIESHDDEALAAVGLLQEVRRGEADGVDGYVVACFGDPGRDAAREVASGPVVGVAEAAMRFATHLGRGSSVVTTLGRTRGRALDLAEL